MMMKIFKDQRPNVNVPKILFGAVMIYILLVVLLYWLMGEQLHLRQSRGNIALPVAETGTIELVEGTTVEQRFTAKIQRLQSISVQWSTYYRPNSGIVTMELYNLTDGSNESLLMAQSFDASSISEGGLTTISAEKPIETAYGVPLLLKIYANSLPGREN